MMTGQLIHYYLYVGGDLLRGDDGNVKYKDGHCGDMIIGRGMTDDAYVARISAKMHNNFEEATFACTLPFDPFAYTQF